MVMGRSCCAALTTCTPLKHHFGYTCAHNAHSSTHSRPPINQPIHSLSQADQSVEVGGVAVSLPCTPLFTENESDWQGGYSKDAFHRRVVNNEVDATNADNEGTKAGLWYGRHITSHSITRQYSRLGPCHEDNLV